ncbi:ATP-binding protein [Ruminococcus bicirculans (ex Wegman et al. 2014)]|uniref:ATP-binding protein n=1 Tax=Ruminococcus bicirculans (ex Wegman et al. 2014) TaxID=1160721 RepID=UPI003FEF6E79
MINSLSEIALLKIFKKSTRNASLIGTNEGITVEYKESFGWKSLSEYFKSMAAFSNRDGGYIIFGIKDKPHELLGLKSEALKRFEEIDNQVWSTHLREHFSPEIIWEKIIFNFEGNNYGVLYTYSAKEKPVICKKDADELRKGAIYYRYNSQNSEIDYPELHNTIEEEKNKINSIWMQTIRQIGDSGVTKTALLDLKSGKMTGANTSLYIDESLLNDISFVQEGSFVETGGNPALKVVGQVQTVVGAQRVVVEQERNKAINADEIINSFITQEKVNNPLEFVKQICYQNTGNMPVYYYLNLANKNDDEAISFIESVPINSMSKDLLKRRISQKEIKFVRCSNSISAASKRKTAYLQSLLEESLIIPTSETELKYCLSAIRGLERSQIKDHKDYILNVMYEIYTNYFNNQPFSSIKPEFRYSLCWIDEAMYMNW